MNKKQLITVWSITVAICLLVLSPPRYQVRYDIQRGVRRSYGGGINWESVFRYTIPILLVGTLLIYTYRDKKRENR